ncbi:hypothetical protein L21SP5_01222 [Salinivirga cyanobacteriivorans]|uniref:HlyD family secretion protein n=1 Tax=Salinivirga cyanobacteriivorans TaxID=1307839 RepID=A0A0S2HXV2_9BACT|nr:hypothetical protein [Salinivirga cyanobacteriivorans]ALO14877.1 hypothetical protein L21SP5_01222 [Salinivirga cyanobacteriivorans]
MPEDFNNIQLRSRKVREIIGKIPPYMVRVGTSVIFFILVMLFLLVYFLPYKTSYTGSAVFIKNEKKVAVFGVLIPENSKNDIKLPLDVYLFPDSKSIKFSAQLTKITDSILINNGKAWYQATAKTKLPVKANNNGLVKFTSGDQFVVEFMSVEKTLFQRLFKK